MLKEDVYQRTSTEFGTSVGVASIIGYSKRKDHIKEYTKESYQSVADDLDINGIINEAISHNLYQPLQREIYKINNKKDKRIKKELTIYKRALSNIMNPNG